uniref:Uncharacterized protein n=1 Tax=Triticum urartu TaxID=4572 RepID=A0A8R7UB91_TRIUA
MIQGGLDASGCRISLVRRGGRTSGRGTGPTPQQPIRYLARPAVFLRDLIGWTQGRGGARGGADPCSAMLAAAMHGTLGRSRGGD